jgi:hypothetical protein
MYQGGCYSPPFNGWHHRFCRFPTCCVRLHSRQEARGGHSNILLCSQRAFPENVIALNASHYERFVHADTFRTLTYTQFPAPDW